MHGNGTYMCPLSVDSHSKVPADPTDQILTVLSELPLTRRVPSLLNATDKTEPEWPVNEHCESAL